MVSVVTKIHKHTVIYNSNNSSNDVFMYDSFCAGIRLPLRYDSPTFSVRFDLKEDN